MDPKTKVLAGKLMQHPENKGGEVKETEARLRTEIEKVKYDLLKWQFAIAFALAAIMAKGFGWIGF